MVWGQKKSVFKCVIPISYHRRSLENTNQSSFYPDLQCCALWCIASWHWNVPFELWHPVLLHCKIQRGQACNPTSFACSGVPYSLFYHLPCSWRSIMEQIHCPRIGGCFYTKVALWLFKVHLSSYATFKEVNTERLSVYSCSMLSSFQVNGREIRAFTCIETFKSLRLFQPQKEAVILWNAFCIFKILEFSTEVKREKKGYYFKVLFWCFSLHRIDIESHGANSEAQFQWTDRLGLGEI